MTSEEEQQTPKKRQSGLEELENRLYSNTPPPLHRAEEFSGEEKHIRIAPGWTAEAERKESTVYSLIATIMPWLKRFFIVSVVFFLFAAGLAMFGFWRGSNVVSSRNISVEVIAPVAGAAGEELSMEIVIGNDNALNLDSVDLLVEYPDGTRRPGNLSEPLPRYRDSLGALGAGERAARTLTFVPFGEEGEKKVVSIIAEYRPSGSNAIFSKKTEYEFLISSAPVTLIIGLPQEVSADQTFDITIEVGSNSSAIQKDLLLAAEYPFGFQFTGSSPDPTFGKDVWRIGDLAPGAKRSIHITGKIVATEESERTFRFSTGTMSPKDEHRLGTVFLTEVTSIFIRRPFMGLDLLVNGERGTTFVARSGQTVRSDVTWSNNLPTKIANLEITATLTGEIYNRSSISISNGFYDSNTGMLRWSEGQTPRFGLIEPGEDGTQNFSFVLLPVATNPALYKNPQMTITVEARGKRLDETGAYQNVSATVVKNLKIASALSLNARLLHSEGLFLNSGPIPPSAENETTYTVVWSLANASNGVANARVSAVLPSYVHWLGRIEPPGEDLIYSPVGGELVWNVGDIEAGVGMGTSPREVSFQVSILPSLSQVGVSPALVGETVARGMDRFTGIEILSNSRSALTTASLNDAGAGLGSGVVVR